MYIQFSNIFRFVCKNLFYSLKLFSKLGRGVPYSVADILMQYSVDSYMVLLCEYSQYFNMPWIYDEVKFEVKKI